jgi:hypothetical protein
MEVTEWREANIQKGQDLDMSEVAVNQTMESGVTGQPQDLDMSEATVIPLASQTMESDVIELRLGKSLMILDP